MNNKGFTLVEILVSMGVLLILIAMGTGGLVQVVGSHRHTQALQRSMNDLNFTMESMSRHIRFGKDYVCTKTVNGNCEGIETNFEGDKKIRYATRLQSGVGYIMRRDQNPTGTWSDRWVTSPNDIDIRRLNFYIEGDQESDGMHPRVTIVMEGVILTGGDDEVDFVLQTTVDQRFNE